MCWLSMAANKGGLNTECCEKVAPSYDMIWKRAKVFVT